MRIFGAIVQIAALPMLHAWEHFSFGSAIAREFVGDEYTWDVGAALEELAEKLFGCCFVASALDQDI